MRLVVIRGGGDIASGVAYRLHMSGYKVIILEVDKPATIRRRVSFSEAVYVKKVIIEGVKGILASDLSSIAEILEDENIPVFIDAKGDVIKEIKPLAVVDAIIAKTNIGTSKKMAPITIGVGPGFEASVDVDLVIESQRGHYLGKVIYKGKSANNTGLPTEVMGYTTERVLRAPCEGIVKSLCYIGDTVKTGEAICKVGQQEIVSQIDGVLRGLIKDGYVAYKGLKIGDIDPRGIREYTNTISDKARAIGGGVLEGIAYLREHIVET